MNHRIIPGIGAGVTVLLAGALLFARDGGTLDAGRARDILRHLGGGELSKDQVRIKSVSPGPAGNDVIVEAQVETAYRFAQTPDGWKVAEVRLGDRQWESVELVTEAVRREKVRRTIIMMRQLASALELYRIDHNGYVVAENGVALLDELSPKYVTPAFRFDLWGTPFNYRGTAADYQLASAGPDRQAGTGDDLVMENGALKSPPQ
ncbi:MAG TPA: type II secretion system protein GspG [Blastocatellia bacterium]|nr:type II secretion system protein GspG [Blastocatellia bacterium]